MAEVALPQGRVEEDLLAPDRDRVEQTQGQRELLLPSQRELEGLQCVELRVGRQPEVALPRGSSSS
jgi:hypothetical protein